MPPTRTTPLRHGSRQPLQPQHTPPNNNIAREIIVLSSDDDEPSTRKPVVKRSKPRPKQKRKQTPVAPPPPPPEVVEITSDEDSPPKDAMQELREQLEKAKRVRHVNITSQYLDFHCVTPVLGNCNVEESGLCGGWTPQSTGVSSYPKICHDETSMLTFLCRYNVWLLRLRVLSQPSRRVRHSMRPSGCQLNV